MTWKNVVAQRAAAAEYLRPSRSGWMLLPAVFRIKPPFVCGKLCG